MGKRLTEEEKKTISSLAAKGMRIMEISKKVGRDRSTVRLFCKEGNIAWNHERPCRRWTEEMDEKLISLYPDMSNAAIAKEIGHGISESSIDNRSFCLGLKKSEKYRSNPANLGRFLKGGTPVNKGRKMRDYMSEEQIRRISKNWFQKGHDYNNKPLGYTRITKGYIEVRVDGHKKNFIPLSHLVWEKRYGPVPEGYVVRFKDRNPMNCDIDNLYLMSLADNMRANSYMRYPEEYREVINMKCVLKRRINKVIKENENKSGNKPVRETGADERQDLHHR